MAYQVIDRGAGDRKAASEGQCYLVVVGRKRIAYAATHAEAMQIARKVRGRVLNITDLHLS